MRPVIHTIKHIVQKTNTSITNGAITNLIIADGAVAPATATTSEIIEGSKVATVWVEIWLLGGGSSGIDTQFILAIEKVPASMVGGMSFGSITNLMAYANKNNILHVSQGVIGDNGTQSIPIYRGWLKIPKGKQRFIANDRLIANLTTIGADMQSCSVFVYKEQR